MRIGDRVIGVITVMVNRPYAYSDEDERLLVTIADQVAVAVENARLFEETRRGAAQLALVNDIGGKIASVLELESVLERVVKLVHERFSFDHVAFLTVDREHEELVIKVRRGSLAEVLPVGNRIPLGKGLVGEAGRSGKTRVVNDVNSEPRYVNPRPDVVNTQSELVVPVRIGDQTVGVLDIQSPKLHAFDVNDVAVLETLAHQIAVAIANARLFEETRKRADRLALVNRISKATSAVLQLDGLMEHVYQEIAPVFQVDTFLIALYDEEAEELDFRFQVDEGVRVPPERLPLGTGVSSIVVTEKKPLITRTKEEYERLLPSGQHLFGTMKVSASWLGVPLMIGERVIGVVSVQSYRPYAFGEEEELLLSTIADQIAIATENARLYGEVQRELTERKRAEEKIRRLNQFQESIIDNANVWINVLDEEANIVLWNKAAEKISGYSGEEIIGHGKVWEWLYPDEASRKEIAGKVAAILKSGKEDVDLETIIRCKDGQTKIISWNSKNLIDDEGTFAGSITLGQDVTELRQAEEQIQRYISEIEAANEEVKQFAYIVSHDLRAPLVNLKGFAAELRSALQDISPVIEVALPTLDEESRHDIDVAFREDIPEALGFIESSATRMDSFINAVLKLSRLGRRELSLRSVDTNAVVEAARQSLAHQIEQRRVNLTVTDLPEVVADQTSMEQIVGNLFANALLYLDPDRPGEIEIGGKQDGSTTTFWVRDNGRGISKDDAPKVFAPFRRAGKQDVLGEGMGLSYVKTTVRMHGGHIWFESEPDVGTTFFFTIANDLAKGETDGGQTRG